jgi:hypothetical protein
LTNQQPDPNRSSSSLFNIVLKSITIANQGSSSFHLLYHRQQLPPKHIVPRQTTSYAGLLHIPSLVKCRGQQLMLDGPVTHSHLLLPSRRSHSTRQPHISLPQSNDRHDQQLMADGVIVALTAPAFSTHIQHALIVCVVVSAIAIVLTSSPHPVTSSSVETAMVLVAEAPQRLLLC